MRTEQNEFFPTDETPKKPPRKKLEYTPDFLKFYENTYPRKEGKQAAMKAWAKLSEDDRRAAQADVEKRNRFKAWASNKTMVKLPATYLNGAHWEDDWMSTFESAKKSDENKPNTGPMEYVPREVFTLPPLQAQACKLFLGYCSLTLGKCNDVDMLKARDDCIKLVGRSLMEDIKSKDKGLRDEAIRSFSLDLLSRWDRINERNIAEQVIAHIEAQPAT